MDNKYWRILKNRKGVSGKNGKDGSGKGVLLVLRK